MGWENVIFNTHKQDNESHKEFFVEESWKDQETYVCLLQVKLVQFMISVFEMYILLKYYPGWKRFKILEKAWALHSTLFYMEIKANNKQIP